MDTVTHLLIGYLLGNAFFATPSLVLWTTFMAFFPDVDAIGWFVPALRIRHRGVTHSIPIGVAMSLAGASGLALVWHVPFWQAFSAGMIGFFSHVGLDVLNWGCLLLWPVRREAVEVTVQEGLAGPFVASTLGFATILAGTWLHHAREAQVIVGMLWLAYLVAKLLLKITLVARHGADASVNPTADPRVWRVIETSFDDRTGERGASLIEAKFVPALRERVSFASRHRIDVPPLPLKSPQEAAAFTFSTREVQALAARGLALAQDAREDERGGWTVRWFALDSARGRGCFGALVRVAPDGAYVAKRGLLELPARGGDAS